MTSATTEYGMTSAAAEYGMTSAAATEYGIGPACVHV
jgi:hypothetical protein